MAGGWRESSESGSKRPSLVEMFTRMTLRSREQVANSTFLLSPTASRQTGKASVSYLDELCVGQLGRIERDVGVGQQHKQVVHVVLEGLLQEDPDSGRGVPPSSPALGRHQGAVEHAPRLKVGEVQAAGVDVHAVEQLLLQDWCLHGSWHDPLNPFFTSN